MMNPISEKARGWLYVMGIIVGALCFVGGTVLEVLDLHVYSPILTSISAAVATAVGILARANLGDSDLDNQGDYDPKHDIEV